MNSLIDFFPALSYTVPIIGEYSLQPFFAALVLFLGLMAFFYLLRAIVLTQLHSLTLRVPDSLAHVIVSAVKNIHSMAYIVGALSISLKLFTLPGAVDTLLLLTFSAVVVWQLIMIALRLLDFIVVRYVEKDEDGDGEVDPGAANAAQLVNLFARILLWSFGFLIILSNLGVNITSLVAGLGIGGIAIAFALQGILSDLFASFSIYFDKPFRVGDFVQVGTDAGTVEKIGIKSTRIRTLQGEQLIVSNAELTTARVQNFNQLKERRIVTNIGITYETPQELVREVPGIVTRIFEDIDTCRLDRVYFTTFGDSALIFEIVYFVESKDIKDYFSIQQDFGFALMARFAEVGIDFAYPTQTIYTKAA